MIRNTHPVSPGIGDFDDLKLYIHESSRNKVFPAIQSGWLYINNQEEYMFAKEGSQQFLASSGAVTNLNIPTSVDLRVPTINGPIIIDGDMFRWTRLSSSLAAFRSLTPVASGTSLLFIPVPGELIKVTSAAGVDMVSVPTTGHLVERDFYYWDGLSNLLWISRNPSDSNRTESLNVTYFKTTPDLLQEEITLVDSDGKVRTMFDRVAFGNLSTNPVIYKIGVGTVQVSGVASNVLYPTTILSEGDTVAVRYYVDGSFLVLENPSGIGTSISTFRSIEDHCIIRWEQAYHYSAFDTETFVSSDNRYVQLNPLINGCESGFVYISNPRHPTEDLTNLKLTLSPLRISTQHREPVRILVRALDSNGEPLSKVKIDCWIREVGNNDTTYFPVETNINTSMNGGTNFKGECSYLWSSYPFLTRTFTVNASAMTPNGPIFTSHPLYAETSPIATNLVNSAKVTLYLNPNKSSDGFHDLYAYLTNQSGIPYKDNLRVGVRCNKGLLFTSRTYAASGTDSLTSGVELAFGDTSLDGLRTAVCKYKPVYGDTIVAQPLDNTSDANPDNWSISGAYFESTPLIVTIE